MLQIYLHLPHRAGLSAQTLRLAFQPGGER